MKSFMLTVKHEVHTFNCGFWLDTVSFTGILHANMGHAAFKPKADARNA